ncbi:MAG: hypothetical protein ACD_42C00207G0003 [uncultured bacterium]|nr:MAG: hypothetical protein ACD_42C00207G0003 [uncultured bacterium]OGT34404.1 MAG: hypothetical protein A3C44_05555 [Gammaproteobacteria bacterium RIFCSPHIGHO2_02_FULL_39_13]OGT50495.1 MAG: hypothetical protein A3E53_06805 [Gammaproteobacteria bacterium RIFCSPHIGHO2_12_FULL_39_24]
MNDIRILYLENNGIDAGLVKLVLEEHDFQADVLVVDNKEIFCEKLDKEKLDLILMDYDVPHFNAKDAIRCVREKESELPIIVISGAIGYSTAIDLIKQGAHDYILRENLATLPSAISRTLKEHRDTLLKKKQEKTQDEVLKITQTGIFKMNEAGKCFFVNEPLCEMLGYSKKVLLDDGGWVKFVAEEEKRAFQKLLDAHLKAFTPFEIKTKVIAQSGKEIWVKCNFIPEVSDKNTVEYIGAVTDVTHLKKTEDELLNLSLHDPLTSLPNRRFFEDALQVIISESNRGLLNPFAVFYVDLDYFKKVNDLLGHQSGDDLLKQAAQRFKSILRKYDVIARIGGDEFLIILKHINSVGEIAFLADRFLTEFRTPFYIDGNECLTTLSIGVAYIENTTGGIDAEKIIQKADQALYRAKARGRNCYEIFTENLNHEIQHAVFIENALRHAIEKSELYIVFQPQIDIIRTKIFGFEVLVRWKQAAYGEIPPSIFIPIAEETKQINQIGDWIIDEALRTQAELEKTVKYFQKNKVEFSINVSAVQLLQENLIEVLSQKIEKHHIDFEKVVFEITETNIIQNIDVLKKQFSRTTNTHIKIAIDDFGVGYSSFSRLRELPIKILKIDQSFVQEIENDSNCRSIIKSIATLAREMNIIVIAEGVETQAQVDFLFDNNCTILQGFYYSRPLLIEQVEKFVDEWEKNNKK